MATYPVPRKTSLTVFNPTDYQADYDEDTIDYGDTRYLVKSTGGTISGSTVFNNAVQIDPLETSVAGSITHSFQFITPATEVPFVDSGSVIQRMYANDTPCAIQMYNKVDSILVMGINPSTHATFPYAGYFWMGSDRTVRFGTNNTERMRLNPSSSTTGVSITSAGVGTGSSSGLTYTLNPCSSFSSDRFRFGSRSLYVPYSRNSGLTVQGLSTSSFSGAWTIEFWFFPATGSSIVYLMSTQYTATNRVDISTSATNQVRLNISSNGVGLTITHSSTFNVNAWNHVSIGYNGSNTYFISSNGTYQSSTSAVVLDWSLIGSLMHFGSVYQLSYQANTLLPTFSSPFNGYIDEIRFSNTQRYTANFTPSTSAFVVDSSTFFLHHCESLIASQDSPTLTSTSSITDASGNMAVVGDITSAAGNLTLTSGNISSTRGSVNAYQQFSTTHPGWRIGGSSFFSQNPNTISGSTTFGCYTITGPWTVTDASTHTIAAGDFVIHSPASNLMCVFTIYCSDKAVSGSKLGIIEGHYLLSASGGASFYTISTTKNASLTTFSVTTSSTSLVITTDTSCRICWRADVSV